VATSNTSRFGQYLASTKNIAGCVLALGGPALAITGVVNPVLGLSLLPALYAIGALATPNSQAKPLVLAAGLDPADITKSLAQIQERIRGKVPSDIAERVNYICDAVQNILADTQRLESGSPDLHTLVKTATDYLPNAVQAYIDLPRGYADSRIISEGKTAHDILREQLDLLAQKLSQIEEAVNKADADKLLAHGRFLEEKFGSKPLDIERETP